MFLLYRSGFQKILRQSYVSNFNPLRKKRAKRCVAPENCLRIFKLSKSVNGKESIPAQSTCHMASIQLSDGEGGSEKLDLSTALGRLNCMARSQHPFCESLIHENEIARGHAKTVSQSESINLNSSILKDACQT